MKFKDFRELIDYIRYDETSGAGLIIIYIAHSTWELAKNSKQCCL